MFRKTSTMLLILIIAISLQACGKAGEENTLGVDQVQTIIEKETVKESDNNGTHDVNISSEAGKSIDLPGSYPQKDFPVYEKSYIISAIEMQKSYTVTAFSKESVSKVMDFYVDVLKDAKVTSETKTEISLTSFGTIAGYTYNIDVGESSEMEGYKTSIVIILTPAQ